MKTSLFYAVLTVLIADVVWDGTAFAAADPVAAPGEPVQIVRFNRQKPYVSLLGDALKGVLSRDELRGHEAIIVSMTGSRKLGKSYMLNLLLYHLNARVSLHIYIYYTYVYYLNFEHFILNPV